MRYHSIGVCTLYFVKMVTFSDGHQKSPAILIKTCLKKLINLLLFVEKLRAGVGLYGHPVFLVE